jgi:hypothetical protein
MLLLADAGPAAAKMSDDLQKLTAELLRLEREMLDAFVSGDAAVLERDLAPDYVHTNFIGGRTDKHQEIYEFYAPGRFKLQGGDVANPTVRDYGEVAIFWADVTWRGATYTPPGRSPIDLSGVYAVTNVFHRSGERWLLAAAHASRRPASA